MPREPRDTHNKEYPLEKLSQVQFRYLYDKPISPGGMHRINVQARHYYPANKKDPTTGKLVEDASGNHVQVAKQNTFHDAGHMDWDGSGKLEEIHVDTNFRRKGVATKMWNVAKAYSATSSGAIPHPTHSNERTFEGDQWAKSTGDPVPKNEHPSNWPDAEWE